MSHALNLHCTRNTKELIHDAIVSNANTIGVVGTSEFFGAMWQSSSASFPTAATMRETSSAGMRRKSFFVELRQRISKDAISLKLGDELLVGDSRLFAAFGHDG